MRPRGTSMVSWTSGTDRESPEDAAVAENPGMNDARK